MREPLTDAELAFGASESPQALEQLKLSYRELRLAYSAAQATIAAHEKRDRSAILRMAGNIASGLVEAAYAKGPTATVNTAEIAEAAVAFAQAILARVDGRYENTILTRKP